MINGCSFCDERKDLDIRGLRYFSLTQGVLDVSYDGRSEMRFIMRNILQQIETLQSLKDLQTLLSDLKSSMELGNGSDGYLLALLCDPDSTILPPHLKAAFQTSTSDSRDRYEMAYNALLKNANGGDGEAMHLVSTYFQTGLPPVAPNIGQCVEWCNRAFEAGYLFAANDLYSLYSSRNGRFYDPVKASFFLDILENRGLRVVEVAN
jgi:TPR repeat protein